MCIYFPVLNLPLLGKLIEQAVAEQFQSFLDETSALDPFQSGFRTETMLTALVDDFQLQLDQNSYVLNILLDLSAVFDTTNHLVLVSHLALLGIWGRALNWFSSLLQECFQKVAIGEKRSSMQAINCGVP